MEVKTKFEIGDVLFGKRIISVHIYKSEKKETERYYLGNAEWVTLNKGDKK